MTGPEHYRQAESLVNLAGMAGEDVTPTRAELTALAQVHATLALAAATALNHATGGMPISDYDAWVGICAT